MNVILLGAPGCGKGTQATGIVKKYGPVHISTGNMFREEIAKKSELGLKVEESLKSGRLVPDELTVEIVKSRLAQPDVKAGFLMDGFPRTVGQAEALDQHLQSLKWSIDAVIYFEIPDAELVRRLSNRRQCSTCGKIYNLLTQPPRVPDKCDADAGALAQREDDMPATIQKRLMVFHDLTQPLIAFYRGMGSLHAVDGGGEIGAVSAAIAAILDRFKK